MYSPNFGLKQCNDLFLTHRHNVKCRGISRAEFFVLPIEEMKPHCQRYIKKHSEELGLQRTLNKCYDLYYGTITNFRPSEAIKLYSYLGCKSVLDPCAGWGGRCFAAMELGLDYMGFDTNTNLKSSFEELISKYKKTGTAEIRFQDSSKADFSLIQYDCLFTSPPYNKRELYEMMPEYNNGKDFIQSFIKPMMTNGFQHLKVGGSLCINVPEAIYKKIVEFFGESDDKIIYNAKYRQSLKREKTKKEYIYIWRKK
jgi:hypothetical protein